MADLGKNMLDIRISNRVAILNLFFAKGGLSRKEIAAQLNLTPGAITIITGELIEEGILLESKITEGSKRLGRREVILDIDRKKLKVLCAFFGNQEARVTCVNFVGEIDFIDNLSFSPNESGANIFEATSLAFQEYMAGMSPQERKWIVGVGLGIKGIYDSKRGVSVRSFGLWEDEVPVCSRMEEMLKLKVLAANNADCVVNAEWMFHQSWDMHSILLVRYGPLIGSALVINNKNYSGYHYRSMEIAHTIVDPMGAECRCGKRGCLETRIGFDVITAQLELHYSPAEMPILYQLTGGDRRKISMKVIMESYERNEPIVCRVLEGAMDHLALAIANTVSILDPEKVVLYGMPFACDKYLQAIKEKTARLMRGQQPLDMERSRQNLYLEDIGCASIVIKDFLDHGAKFTNGSTVHRNNDGPLPL